MEQIELHQSAMRLPKPAPESAHEFTGKQDILAALLTEKMLARADLMKMIDKDSIEMMKDNHRNQLRFMSSMLAAYQPEVFLETVLWVFRVYRSHGFQTTYWAAMLDTAVEIFKTELTPKTFSEISPFYLWLIVNIPVFTKLTDRE